MLTKGTKVRRIGGVEIGEIYDTLFESIWVYVRWPDGNKTAHLVKYGTPDIVEM